MVSMPTLYGRNFELKRQEIKDYFQYCYKRYEALFNLIADEKAYFKKADPLRHPIIFYYGHTATFFIVTILQGLEEILDKDFKLIDTKDVPFVIQKAARKHQYTIAQMTVWQK